MSQRTKAKLAFMAAVLLLILSGVAAYFSITRLLESEQWVIHTHEIRNTLAEVDWALLKAARARTGYVISEDGDSLSQFEAALPAISRKIQDLRGMVRDNPRQQELCSRLEDITARRIALLRESVALKKDTPESEARLQADFARRNLPLAAEMTSIMQQMWDEEQRLLETREITTHRLFVLTVVILAVAFVLALALFSIQYRFLSGELTARQQAEQVVRDSEDSLRRLTRSLLRLQDAERRKFSRELHDSLGQYLAGVKMNLEMFAIQHTDNFLVEAAQLVDQAIAETRTLSHLLHPPLLDEAGFSSAARWYLEGFAQRSGIEIKLDLPDNIGQLPKPVALGLFRVLQESLTNLHRHSNSTKAEVVLTMMPGEVVLKIRDYGKGIAPELLQIFRTRGTNSGVGLAGMRERMRELGGHLNIQPCTPGTMISASLPFQESRQMEASAAD